MRDKTWRSSRPLGICRVRAGFGRSVPFVDWKEHFGSLCNFTFSRSWPARASAERPKSAWPNMRERARTERAEHRRCKCQRTTADRGPEPRDAPRRVCVHPHPVKMMTPAPKGISVCGRNHGRLVVLAGVRTSRMPAFRLKLRLGPSAIVPQWHAEPASVDDRHFRFFSQDRPSPAAVESLPSEFGPWQRTADPRQMPSIPSPVVFATAMETNG